MFLPDKEVGALPPSLSHLPVNVAARGGLEVIGIMVTRVEEKKCSNGQGKMSAVYGNKRVSSKLEIVLE